jgi:transposase
VPRDVPERHGSWKTGRPPSFDRQVYKKRNVVERCFNRLKQWRDLATRYAERAAIYQASLTIAAIMTWLR